MDRTAELRNLLQMLKDKLPDAQGSGAAALGLQIRILAGELDGLEQGEMSKVDELAARRKSKTSSPRPPARRRQSRRGTSGD